MFVVSHLEPHFDVRIVEYEHSRMSKIAPRMCESMKQRIPPPVVVTYLEKSEQVAIRNPTPIQTYRGRRDPGPKSHIPPNKKFEVGAYTCSTKH